MPSDAMVTRIESAFGSRITVIVRSCPSKPGLLTVTVLVRPSWLSTDFAVTFSRSGNCFRLVSSNDFTKSPNAVSDAIPGHLAVMTSSYFEGAICSALTGMIVIPFSTRFGPVRTRFVGDSVTSNWSWFQARPSPALGL